MRLLATALFSAVTLFSQTYDLVLTNGRVMNPKQTWTPYEMLPFVQDVLPRYQLLPSKPLWLWT